jgi:dCTP deaminase
MSNDDIIVQKNDRVVQMILHEVRDGDRCYSGRYQDSLGAVEAK